MTNIEVHAIIIADRYKGDISDEKKLHKLGEEMMELAVAFGKNDKENINEEIGDVAFVLLHFAKRMNPNKSLLQYIEEAAEKMELKYS